MHFNKDLNIAASGEDTEDASVASSVNKLLRGSLRTLKLDTTRERAAMNAARFVLAAEVAARVSAAYSA